VLAIDHAQSILAWHEHMKTEDIPPKWMWHLADELGDHFDRLRAAQGSGRSDTDDDSEMPGQYIQNEYARGRGRDAR
jgi:hypothetical protein